MMMPRKLNDDYITLHEWRTENPEQYAALFDFPSDDAVEAIFLGLYDFRYLRWRRDDDLFDEKLSAAVGGIFAAYDSRFWGLDAGVRTMIADIVADQATTWRELYPAPNGAVSTAHTQGAEMVMTDGNGSGDTNRPKFILEEYLPFYIKKMDVFASLFLGVIE